MQLLGAGSATAVGRTLPARPSSTILRVTSARTFVARTSSEARRGCCTCQKKRLHHCSSFSLQRKHNHRSAGLFCASFALLDYLCLASEPPSRNITLSEDIHKKHQCNSAPLLGTCGKASAAELRSQPHATAVRRPSPRQGHASVARDAQAEHRQRESPRALLSQAALSLAPTSARLACFECSRSTAAGENALTDTPSLGAVPAKLLSVRNCALEQAALGNNRFFIGFVFSSQLQISMRRPPLDSMQRAAHEAACGCGGGLSSGDIGGSGP